MRLSLSSLVLLVLALSLSQETSAFVAPHRATTRPQASPTLRRTSFATSTRVKNPASANRGSLSSTRLYNGVGVDAGKTLTTFFLETLIANGVPALFTVLVIGFAASALRPRKKDQDLFGGGDSPLTELYNDLYETPSSDKNKNSFSFFKDKPPTLAQNTGIPAQQYIRIENRNSKLNSYQYSMTAATQSKALAAKKARSTNFDRALRMAVGDELTAHQKSLLLNTEKAFLKRASRVQAKLTQLQTQLTKTVIDEEMKALGMSPKEMDPENTTSLEISNNETAVTLTQSMLPMPFGGRNPKLFKEINALQESLMKLELAFVQDVINICGPERANGIKAALLGDVSVQGGGSLAQQIQSERPLSVVLGNTDDSPQNVFVTQFPGDAVASQVSDLREEVTAIIRNAKPGDEALVVLQTGGGTVTGYGLAAAQLQRFKEAGMKLTICVEQVAASGGYMMCCVADRIIASPFAVLGSIGVISDIPNVYERLKEEGIEFQTITAGKYKRTVTPTKKVTQEDIKKSKQDVEEILKLFKTFVKENRPSLDIDKVATGETWFGTDALERDLCDEIRTADDVVTEYVDMGFNVFDVKYEPPPEQPEFSRLLPATSSEGLISRAVRWLARTVASEFRSELDDLASSSQRPDRKYTMKDDTAEKIRLD